MLYNTVIHYTLIQYTVNCRIISLIGGFCDTEDRYVHMDHKWKFTTVSGKIFLIN